MSLFSNVIRRAWNRKWVCAALCGLVALVLFLSNRQRVPSYYGKPFHWWVVASRGNDLALREQATGVLVEALRDSDPCIRIDAAQSLWVIMPTDARAISALVSALKDPNSNVRKAATVTLGGIRPPSRDIVVAISKQLRDPDAGVSDEAFQSLIEMRGEAKDAVPILIEYIKDSDGKVLWQATTILESIGPDAKEAVPALERIAFHKNNKYQRLAQQALRKIRQEE